MISRVAVAEWLARLTAGQEVCGSNSHSAPLLKHTSGPATMLAIYTGRGISHMPPPSVIKRKHHQKSDTGVSVAPKIDMCLAKNFEKIERKICMAFL